MGKRPATYSQKENTMSSLTREEAKAAMVEHVKEFIEMELTNKLSSQLDKLMDSGALPLDGWNGVDLKMPRCVTAALLEEAADRVVNHSERKKHQREIKNLRAFL